MAHDLSYWQTRVDVLEQAYTSGVLSTRHGDTQLQYRSLDELAKALSYAKGKVTSLSGDNPGRVPGYILQGGKDL